ncbi:metal-dependent hydrolase [Mycobacterium sp. NAZ190054]|uniref:metal-dependent hydrolase n=1 Tax=Mycobacterium sp. NAZ190054 TaxID=1747766 RepID=UPI0007985E20|nr:metal-dependent hydrolase [Mycobacterium sp. NAZ190054]KWX57767.1 hypothetical protein ASJ79_10495 [Mycobacterium sp. NAZ190054]
MTDLVIRKIPFEFDRSVPFNWQPENPIFSAFCNLVSFGVVSFEKYIISVVRMAQDKFVDPEIAAEAQAFLRQEAQHASAHRKHMLALIEQYPALEDAYQHAVASYEELLAAHDLEFHLSYIANIEGCFAPLLKVVLDHREALLEPGDQRVASLMMWHFVEEIEHRSSGLVLYQYLTPNRWTRTKYAPQTFKHSATVTQHIAAEIDRVVPESDRVISLVDAMKVKMPRLTRSQRTKTGVPAPFHAVPTRNIASMLWWLFLAQLPHHDPTNQPVPESADLWMREYARGTDMTAFCGTPVLK